MRKTVIVFGLLSGAVSSGMMLASLPLLERVGFDHTEILGYATIVASFLLVFFGIRSYRERVAGGSLTFGRAFTVGLLITLVSCVCYVATWQLIYFKLSTGFSEKYSTYYIEKVRASGASQEQVDATAKQMEEFKVLYDNPIYNPGLTLLEPLPIGLAVTLVSAATLRRRPR
jgi:uncharacterized membrane protein (UPF0136 family)